MVLPFLNKQPIRMDTAILTAIIAGGVSLVISFSTFWLTRYSIKSERVKLERELERKLTEKLYDRRISTYPEAFSITQGLVGYIIPDDTFGKKETSKILDKLVAWQSGDASFILSKKSLKSFYKLRESLLQEPDKGDFYSEAQKKAMWECKNDFRASLRKDVKLLFREDDLDAIQEI